MHALKPLLRYDDVTNAFALHGVAGTCGSMLAAVAAQATFGGSQAESVLSTQAAVQAVACAVTAAWSFVATSVLALIVTMLCGGLRVDAETEEAGTDLLLRETDAYSAT